ncbi:MAG TPA: CDP-alcohol phosphatidyltransferase family protein [Candidatus Limnocylindrales bacterium]|nr:CDP-alcohol phosphatidyltransferase family protein [Candidatus Limnocylindrales bacterium]
MSDQSFVPPALRARIRGGAEPLAAGLGRLGLTPNALTVMGFLISCAAAALCALGIWLPGGVVSLAGAAFDLLDGSLARVSGRTSRLGAFFDSTFDRWGEGVVYAGIVTGGVAAAEPVTAVLAALAMSSAFMVSYTRAKAEGLGFHGEVGVAPRAERVVLLGLGLIGAGASGGIRAGLPWLQAALAVLFILATITTIQRVLHVRAQDRVQRQS